jgi:glycosyltransferase involved in cell wall biosynthesis
MTVLYESGQTITKVAGTLIGIHRRVREARNLPAEGVAYVYREAALLGPPWFERRLARRSPFVFDFDDAIFLGDASRANAWARHLRPKGKTAQICADAALVVVGNLHLADFARRHANEVTVIPSTIDTEAYQIRERPANTRPIIGWTGSATTSRYLEALRPVLVELRRRRSFELRVIGADVRLPELEVRCLPWAAQTEVEDLRPIDVGLMPLADDQWSLGKCGMKALQYMALGIPPVVSPVGANEEIVRDGVNGLHARTPGDWVTQVVRLIDDRVLRRRLGVAARRTVEESYSARTQAPRLEAALQKCLVAWSNRPRGGRG